MSAASEQETKADRPEIDPRVALWDSVSITDPSHVKAITGKDYQGTSPKPYWIVRRLTETFGPCGIGWGFDVLSERFEKLSDVDQLHVARVRLWYVLDGKRGEIEHIGQTKATYVTSQSKLRVDEDAPKKSVTDALTKCASFLGFAGDIFMGLWDDSKYVSKAREYYADLDLKTRGKVKPEGVPDKPPKKDKLPAGVAPTSEEVADVALKIERAKTDKEVVDLAYKVYNWAKDGLGEVKHNQELARAILARRSELVDEKGLATLSKMVDTFKRSGLCTENEGDVAYNLARTRLNAVEQPAG